MSLSFPNISRNYDASRQTVCFWGYDSAFEVSFFVGREALQNITHQNCTSESDILQAFDANRPRIHQVAEKAYARRPGSYHPLPATAF